MLKKILKWYGILYVGGLLLFDTNHLSKWHLGKIIIKLLKKCWNWQMFTINYRPASPQFPWTTQTIPKYRCEDTFLIIFLGAGATAGHAIFWSDRGTFYRDRDVSFQLRILRKNMPFPIHDWWIWQPTWWQHVSPTSTTSSCSWEPNPTL
jgi:hypothetical protein